MNGFSRPARCLGVLAVTLPVLLFAPSSGAAPGDVDTSYGDGGDGIVVPSSGNIKVDLHVGLPDGQSLIAMLSGPGGIKVKRYDQTGNEVWETAPVQPEGYVGYLSLAYDAERDLTYLAGTPDEQFTTRIWRFTSTGELDLDWSPTGYEQYGDGTTESIALQQDGKLVMSGNGGGPGGMPYLRRLRRNGSLDTSFDGDGYWFGTLGSAAGFHEVHVLPNGKILAVGTTQFTMVTGRFLSNGTPDDTWGGDGLASYDPVMPVGSSQTTVWDPALAIRPDNRVVFLAGLNAHDLDPESGFEVPALVGQLRANGTPDPTFPQRIIRGVEHRDNHLALQPNGKVVVVLQLDGDDLSLRRLHRDGTDDASFSNWTSAEELSFARGLQVQPQGRIVMGGFDTNVGISDAWLRAFEGDPVVKCDGAFVTHFGTSSADDIVGTSGSDVVLAYGGADVIHSGGAADRICAGGGNDKAYGGGGPDRIFGNGGADKLFGQDGNDRLVGGAGQDVLKGGPGTDIEKQ